MRDRAVSRQALLNRMRENQNRSNMGKSGLFKKGITMPPFLTVPENATTTLDVIPYWAGKFDPYVREGEEAFVLKIFVHADVGFSSDQNIICLAETFGPDTLQGPMRCPICEERKRKQRDGAPDEIIKRLTPKRFPRELYNVISYNSREEERKGIQVFHTSEYSFGMTLAEVATRPVRPGAVNVEPFIPFMDLKEGKQIVFKREGKGKDTKFIGIRLVDRDYDLDEALIDKAYKLDELLWIPTQTEIEDFFYGPDPSKDQGDTRRAVGTGMDTGGGTGAGTAAEEETGTFRRRKVDPEPAPEPEKQPEPAPEKQDVNPCPAGHRFGHDVDEYKKDCDPCDKWKECARAKAAFEKEQRDGGNKQAEPPPPPPPEAGDEGPRRRRVVDEPPAQQPEPQPEQGTGGDEPPRRRRRVTED